MRDRGFGPMDMNLGASDSLGGAPTDLKDILSKKFLSKFLAHDGISRNFDLAKKVIFAKKHEFSPQSRIAGKWVTEVFDGAKWVFWAQRIKF